MTNLQGDVVSIVNVSGTKVVNYTYDAWGKVLTITGPLALSIGHLNPLRYRGYVYDHETKLYYLQSRYYDPEIGRFLNADAFASTGQGLLGNNMFAYCANNPISYVDPKGSLSFMALDREIQGFIPYTQQCYTGGAGHSNWALSDYTHGEYALEKGSGNPSSNRYHADIDAQKGYWYFDLFSFHDDEITLINGNVGLFKGTLSWWDGLVSITPFDLFGAEVNAGISKSEGLHFSALAYTAAATATLNLGCIEISATGYVGAIGVEFAAGLGNVTIGGAPNGVGGSLTIRWGAE